MGKPPTMWLVIVAVAGIVLAGGVWGSRFTVYVPPPPEPPNGFYFAGRFIAMPSLRGMKVPERPEPTDVTKAPIPAGPDHLLLSDDSTVSVASDIRRDLAGFGPQEAAGPGGSIDFTLVSGDQRMMVSVSEESSDYYKRWGRTAVSVFFEGPSRVWINRLGRR